MRRITNDFSDLYVPNLGAVYSTLHLLEDQGYVACTEEYGRKYALTPKDEKLTREEEGH